MNEYDRDELLIVVGWIDECLDEVLGDNPAWVDTAPESMKELIDTLKVVREKLKQATSDNELW